MLIKIQTKSWEKPKLKHRKDPNKLPLDYFDHVLLPTHHFASPKPTTANFSIYTRCSHQKCQCSSPLFYRELVRTKTQQRIEKVSKHNGSTLFLGLWYYVRINRCGVNFVLSYFCLFLFVKNLLFPALIPAYLHRQGYGRMCTCQTHKSLPFTHGKPKPQFCLKRITTNTYVLMYLCRGCYGGTCAWQTHACLTFSRGITKSYFCFR